jgi:hypothetical protein
VFPDGTIIRLLPGEQVEPAKLKVAEKREIIVETERALRAVVREVYAARFRETAAQRIEEALPERERESRARNRSSITPKCCVAGLSRKPQASYLQGGNPSGLPPFAWEPERGAYVGVLRRVDRLDDFEPFEFRVAECERLALASTERRMRPRKLDMRRQKRLALRARRTRTLMRTASKNTWMTIRGTKNMTKIHDDAASPISMLCVETGCGH